jgi:hypothetical protein
MDEIKQAEIKQCKPGDPCPAGFAGYDADSMSCYKTSECPFSDTTEKFERVCQVCRRVSLHTDHWLRQRSHRQDDQLL